MKIMNALISVLRLKQIDTHTETNVKKAILVAQKSRREVDKKIEDIYAELNGCGDKWFLVPKSSIDECDKD